MPNVRSLERLVRRRALGCCEYCGLTEQYSSAPFQMANRQGQIDRAIQVNDRLLLVLSEYSLNSEWVQTEIQ